MSDTEAVSLAEVIHVLRLARRGDLTKTNDWSTDGFASAVWNGLLAQDDTMAPTVKGLAFLSQFEDAFPEKGR